MAIYPYTNTYVINKDAVAGSSFKAGMPLMMNSDGKAVPADSQVLANFSTAQKQAKFLGLAAGDSNLTGNTIIVPDTVGNNYLDENKNFVNASNAEYLAIKRQLLDYADETINEYYNMNFTPIPKRRGIGVYCLIGDTFATDQFSAVLHGDFGYDNVDTIIFSPGDLLTVGGGLNAGKLVKVNLNSIGPDVLVVGVVEKYIASTGLLYFKLVNYKTNFTNSYIMFSDPGNVLAINSATSMKNLANLSQTILLNNGALISSYYIDYDGANDSAILSTSSLTLSQATYIAWVYTYGVQDRFDGIIFSAPDRPSATGIMFGPSNVLGNHWAGGFSESSLVVPIDSWAFVCFSVSGSGTIFSVNGSFQTGSGLGPATFSNIFLALDPLGRYMKGRIGLAVVISKALTQTEITNYYNATKYRYGL